MSWLMLLGGLLAHADDAPDDTPLILPAPDAVEDIPSPDAVPVSDEEMLIVAAYSLQQTRRELGQDIREMGYFRPIQLRGRSVYLPYRFWKPRVTVTDDAVLKVRGQRFTPLSPILPGTLMLDPTSVDPNRQPLTLSDDLKTVRSAGPGVLGTAQTTRQLDESTGLIVAELHPELTAWRQAIWDYNRLAREEEIRNRLLSIWRDDARAADARRAAILEMWLNTADSTAGERVRTQIEVFMAGTIQTSDAPFTPTEID
ncbi:MAG: hypothetical protein AAFV53_33575, partial [Myxococcota bacterium]